MPRIHDFESYLQKKEIRHREYLGLDIIRYRFPLTVKADAHYLPFIQESIGTVICFESLEHFRDPVLTFQEWARVLKENGLAIVTTVQDWPFHPEPEDHWRFKTDALEILLETSGFEAIASFSMGGGDGMHVIAVGRKTPGFQAKPLDRAELMKYMGDVKRGTMIR